MVTISKRLAALEGRAKPAQGVGKAERDILAKLVLAGEMPRSDLPQEPRHAAAIRAAFRADH